MYKDNNPMKMEKMQVIEWLIEHFPQAFFKKYVQVKPLQLGILDEVTAFYDKLDSPFFSKKALREALRYYSSSKAYLACQKKGVARVDLYGNEVDQVTDEQANYALVRYQERYGV